MKQDPKTGDNSYVATEEFKKLFDAEKEHLGIPATEQNAEAEVISGFAVSGGGIRSASFGLGVMQALVANKQLHKFHYMSTVSGGGYLGSALTWALHQDPQANTSDKFPLGARGSADTKENKRLNFIRQHSSYLLPDNSIGAVSLAGIVIRSTFISLFVYTALLTVVMVLFKWGRLFCPIDLSEWTPLPPDTIQFSGIFIPVAIVLIGVYVIGAFFYSFGTYLNSLTRGFIKNYLAFILGQQFIGILWKLIIVLLVFGSLPYVYTKIGEEWREAAAGGSTVFGMLVGVWQYVKAQKKESSGGAMSSLTIYAGAIALVYGLLLIAYGAAQNYITTYTAFWWLAGTTLFFGLFVSLNQVGPHRIWRNRLMEAFMPNEKAVDENKWRPATDADKALMKDMCSREKPRPYHLINTNLILVDSPTVKYRGRGGDNFIISPLYCGSKATGWRTTDTFQKQVSGITLATAMATSAAALNPNAGVSGEGLTRNTVVSILLSILNLRLGYWTVNPNVTTPLWPANFFMPGLTSEVTRRNMHEKARNIQLSDGGHFENLALYELIRRKAGFIVVSDGGADLQFNFDDLANAVEKARVDFGALIRFRDADMNSILGGTAGDSLFDKKYNIAERGYAVATITYPADGNTPEQKGVLVYIKLAMINDLPTDIYSYKGVNPDFPHQSTADQFFDEKQFEAYRELGYNVMWKMMDSREGLTLFPAQGFGTAEKLRKLQDLIREEQAAAKLRG